MQDCQSGRCPFCGAGVNRHAVKVLPDEKLGLKCDWCCETILIEEIEDAVEHKPEDRIRS
jgi:hypothetical protein